MESIQTSTDTNASEIIRNSDALLIINDSAQNILDAFPLPTALLNIDEEIISVNINFLKLFSYAKADHLIGRKPTEIFNCIYANGSVYDRQIAEQCRNCGENLISNGRNVKCNKFTDNCNLTFVDENGQVDDLHNVKVTTSPFNLDGKLYYLFSINDISNDIRRRLLERIFFHDALNKAGNIIGILDIIKFPESADADLDGLYESLKNTSEDLINEIIYQRDLSAAENNEITPVFAVISSLAVLSTTRSEIINSDVANRKELSISHLSVNREIVTDGILLRRVLLNMVKNALEATPSGGKVTMGCESLNGENLRFWVHNDTSIPEEIQARIFNKTTSTKSISRGLGTFSMKLFGEKYLKGKVSFTSSEEKGTLFMIDLPIQYN